MFEYYNNTLCVPGGWLYNKSFYDEIVKLKKQLKNCFDDRLKKTIHSELKALQEDYKLDEDTIITKYNYDALRSRKTLRSVIVGGNGRESLISYESIPTRIRRIIEERFGNPYEKSKESSLADIIEYDTEARDFFHTYPLNDGSTLPVPTQNEYTINASILKACKEFEANNTAYRRARGGSKMKNIWQKMGDMVKALPTEKFPHSLPSSSRRLREANNKFQKEGYASLIHKNFRNKNSEKLNEESKVWIISRWAAPVNKCATIKQLFFEYNQKAIDKDWTPLKTDTTIRDYLYEPEIKSYWWGHRYGELKAKEKFDFQLSTEMPSMRDSLWYGDGTKLNFFYRGLNKDGKMATMTAGIYEVMDAFSDVFLGFGVYKGNSESHKSQYDAFRMATQIAGHKPYQISHDNQGGHQKLKSGGFFSKISRLQIATQPYNGNSKTIESAFGRFQQQVLAKKWYFSGQNITAKKEESKANMEFILANTENLPSLEEVIAEYKELRKEWNATQHHKTGQPRLEMYLESSNPKTPEFSLLDTVECFYMQRPKTITATPYGLTMEENKVKYTYMVYDENGEADTEWLEANIDRKFVVKYDPTDLSSILLYVDTPLGIKMECEAYIKVEKVHRGIQEQTELDQKIINKVIKDRKVARINRRDRTDQILKDHGELPEQHGLNSPRVKGIETSKKKKSSKKSKVKAVNQSFGEYTKELSNADETNFYNKY